MTGTTLTVQLPVYDTTGGMGYEPTDALRGLVRGPDDLALIVDAVALDLANTRDHDDDEVLWGLVGQLQTACKAEDWPAILREVRTVAGRITRTEAGRPPWAGRGDPAVAAFLLAWLVAVARWRERREIDADPEIPF